MNFVRRSEPFRPGPRSASSALHTGWLSGAPAWSTAFMASGSLRTARSRTLSQPGVVAIGKLRVEAGKRVGRRFLHRLGRRTADQFAASLEDLGLSHGFADDFFRRSLRLVGAGLHGRLRFASGIGLRHAANLKHMFRGPPRRECRRQFVVARRVTWD